MINKKINRIFSCIFFIFSLFLLILSIVNSFILSSKTEAYKIFYKLVDDNYEYVQILLYNNHYYEINTEKEINKIIDDFIDLKENESFSATSRIIISFLSVIFTLFFFYFSLKIKYLNNINYRSQFKIKLICFNLIFIIDGFLIFFEIIDSILMINYREDQLIPYIKILFTNNNKDKFQSRMKTNKNFDILFVIILLILVFGLITIEIKLYNKNKKCCFEKCCKDNEQQEINANQNFNQHYIYNANYNNNLNNGNQQLVILGRNINDGQNVNANIYYQNSINNLNSDNNFNINIIENIPINNNNFNQNENNLSLNNRNINNNNNNETNENIDNNETFFKNLLDICNKDKYNKNKYKKHEDCRICLMKFENNENILILPCLHIFHTDCIINWLKNKKTCPLDNQNLESYLS